MNLNWFESIFYGLISGISDFLPISSKAHQELALLFFGASTSDPVRNLFVHIALLCAVYVTCRPMFEQLRRENSQGYSKYHKGFVTRQRLDLRLVRGATLPMLVGIVVLVYVMNGISGNLLAISGFLLLNGIFLFIPGRMMQGNKDSRAMTQLDAIFIGLCGSIGVVPGLSAMGGITGVCISRGADRQQALNWAFMLCIPALLALCVLDVVQIFSAEGIAFWSSFFTYLLSAAGAFAGGYIGVRLAKLFMARTGFSAFAYYSWGAALLSFLLYLFAV